MATSSSITQSPGIAGKVIVITGASSGIGEDGARYLAARGASVVLGARRADKLKTIVDEITAAGGKAAYATVDVTKAEEVKALVQKAVDTFGKLDVIINNAGLMNIAPLNKLKVSEWDSMIDINIKGVLYGIAAALPIFEKQGHGHFINVSSIAGLKVFAPGGTVYSGTKFAVRAISEGLRMEVSGKIRTTIISPGAVESELIHHISDPESAAAIGDMAKKLNIPAAAISRAFAYAIEQPPEVDISEIIVRPTDQDF